MGSLPWDHHHYIPTNLAQSTWNPTVWQCDPGSLDWDHLLMILKGRAGHVTVLDSTHSTFMYIIYWIHKLFLRQMCRQYTIYMYKTMPTLPSIHTADCRVGAPDTMMMQWGYPVKSLPLLLLFLFLLLLLLMWWRGLLLWWLKWPSGWPHITALNLFITGGGGGRQNRNQWLVWVTCSNATLTLGESHRWYYIKVAHTNQMISVLASSSNSSSSSFLCSVELFQMPVLPTPAFTTLLSLGDWERGVFFLLMGCLSKCELGAHADHIAR